MLFVCLSHFSSNYFTQNSLQSEELSRLGMEIGRVGTPGFVILSGMLLGVLYRAGMESFDRTQAHLIDRGGVLLVLAHPLMALFHMKGGADYLDGFCRVYITDMLAFCVVTGSMLVPRISTGNRLLLALVIEILSVGASTMGRPVSVLQAILYGQLCDTDQCGISYVHFPLLQWFGLYLVGTCLGEMTSGASVKGTVKVILGCSITALTLAALMRVSYQVLLEPQVIVGDSLVSYMLLASPYQKVPPGPFYLMFYLGLATALVCVVYGLDRIGRLDNYLAVAAMIGRNSLLVFLIQEGLYFLLLRRIVPQSSSSALTLWPLYWLASLVVIVMAAYLIDRSGVSRRLTVGYSRLHQCLWGAGYVGSPVK